MISELTLIVCVLNVKQENELNAVSECAVTNIALVIFDCINHRISVSLEENITTLRSSFVCSKTQGGGHITDTDTVYFISYSICVLCFVSRLATSEWKLT